MLELFANPDWSIQTQRLMAEGAYGGSDVFEVARTAQEIQPGSVESWYAGWLKLAERTEAAGRDALSAGSPITGRQRLFRASNYYRHADFFISGIDRRKRENYLRVLKCFRDAIPLQAPTIEPVQVSCGSDVYDGYFCHAKAPTARPGPAVLMLGGADSLAEELYFFGGSEVVERGVSVLILDTPGRGSSLRLKDIVTRPDYEVPFRAAVDYLAARPDVDPARIGCVGVSMAGYYAPRGTAFEPRIKALVLWCGCYDVLEDLYEWYPPIRSQIQWILGVDSDAAARKRLLKFNLNGIAQNITCPTLISHGTGDIVMNVEGAKRLYREIGSKDKTLKLWDGSQGGAIHCNYDNWAVSVPLMFDWLVQRL
jgi:alpha-beta hydrolase superfamily lysophospholipase